MLVGDREEGASLDLLPQIKPSLIPEENLATSNVGKVALHECPRMDRKGLYIKQGR